MGEIQWEKLLKLLQNIDDKLDRIVAVAESYPYAPVTDWLEELDVSAYD